MNLAQFSIEKNRISFAILAVIVIMGMVLYQSLPQNSMPPMTIRMAKIVSSFPGAGPERVEQLVTDKVEKVVQELAELKEVTSTSRTGLSIVTVTLKDQVKAEDLQGIWDELRRKLDGIRDLPQNVFPVLNDEGIGDVYGIVLGLTTDGFSYAELKEYADDLKDDLIKLDNAAKVVLGGIQEERIFVEFDDARLNEYGLSSGTLAGLISSTNIVSSGGEINIEDERIVLEPTGNFNSVDDIKSMMVPVNNNSQLVSLGDITNVRRGYITPTTQEVRVNGMEAVSLHVSLIDGANIVALGEEVDIVFNKWKSNLPIGIEISRLSSMDTFIDNKVDDFVVNLIQSISIVLLVMLIFLGFRTGLVISSLIPIVVIMTFMCMGLGGIGINQVSLAALIMALGMMVDNGIVVAETISVKMERGISAKQSAIEAYSELWMPLLISTLTTAAAFLSFYLAESMMGDIVGTLFLVISIALLSSWLISLTVITLFSYLFMKEKPKDAKPNVVDKIINWLMGYYQDFIVVSLKHKGKVLSAIVGMFFLSLYGFSFIDFIFMGGSDRNMITVDVNLPLGTKIERTKSVIAQIEKFTIDELQVNNEREEGIMNWSSFIGEGPKSYDQGYQPGEANSSYGHILVNTSSGDVNQEMINALDAYCFKNFPGAEIKVSTLAVGMGGTPVEIKISGNSPDVLSSISEKIKLELYGISGTNNVKDNWGPKSKKFVVDIDQIKAKAAGVSSQDIASSLRTVLDGYTTGEYREGDKSIPIVMRSENSQEQTLYNIEALNVYSSQTSQSVPLLQVATIIPEWQYAKIKRL
ncbi:MAG: efflux RND transporter permease subunit, partial [Cytophagales bacterium]|nr:efflux RND transporter permease subunit [Cytophagales bacterium]